MPSRSPGGGCPTFQRSPWRRYFTTKFWRMRCRRDILPSPWLSQHEQQNGPQQTSLAMFRYISGCAIVGEDGILHMNRGIVLHSTTSQSKNMAWYGMRNRHQPWYCCKSILSSTRSMTRPLWASEFDDHWLAPKGTRGKSWHDAPSYHTPAEAWLIYVHCLQWFCFISWNRAQILSPRCSACWKYLTGATCMWFLHMHWAGSGLLFLWSEGNLICN